MASRLCVKGLPKYVSEARLREHFSAKGEVTDAKVVRSKDGASRQFGFVGFRSAEEAADALKYFNRTFIDTSRISVEVAEKFGSQQIARPWSRYSEGSSAHKKLETKQNPVSQDSSKASKKSKKPVHEEEDDPQLAEFLQLMQPRRAGTIWSNDDVTLAQPAVKGRAAQSEARQPSAHKTEHNAIANEAARSSDEEEDYQELPTSRDSDAHPAAESDTDNDDSDPADEADTARDAALLDEGVSDLDYLKSRMKAGIGQAEADDKADSETSSLTDTGPGELGDEGDEEAAEHRPEGDEEHEDAVQQDRRASHAKASTRHADEQMPDAAHDAEDEEPTGRLFLRNLPFTTTEAELSDAFTDFGDLQEVHLVLDRQTKKSRGIAYLQFTQAADAEAAMAAMDGSIFQGRLLHVLPARKAPTPVEAPQQDNVSSGTKYKETKDAERRSQAGNRAAWNTLFMRSDTVAEAVAAHYGISKSQLLSRDAADLPVRMALGEAHVIAMTKKALGDAGVSIEVLEEAAAASGKASASHAVHRSPVCLLVKNLPYTASQEDLTELFGASGPLARLVLPPTKTLALVEFSEPQDARRAFKSMAYKRYQHVPIYLEWAPANIFRADAPKPRQPLALPLRTPAPAAAPGNASAPEAAAAAAVAATAAVVFPDVEDTESSTIYVKNLAFATGDAGLRKHFDNTISSAGGSMRSVKVAVRKGPDGKPLSMGFGFVECSSEDVAKAVLKQLQGTVLDKHKLALQLSMRKASSAARAKKQTGTPEKQSTKLVVRNVAFEATRKEVMSLFSPFGHMKSCRLPRKFDGIPRGFAFIEFVTKQEAKNAVESIAGAHLYGRRLVVEWAEQGDEGLDEIRAKTAAKFRGEAVDDFDEMPAKRRKAGV